MRTAQKPGTGCAGPQQPCGAAPGSEVSLSQLLGHRLLQLGFCQKLFEAGVLLLQLVQPLGLLGLHTAVELPPAVVGRLSDFKDATNVSNGLALGQQLLSGFELADDLLGGMAGSFHGGVPGLVCRMRTLNHRGPIPKGHVRVGPTGIGVPAQAAADI